MNWTPRSATGTTTWTERPDAEVFHRDSRTSEPLEMEILKIDRYMWRHRCMPISIHIYNILYVYIYIWIMWIYIYVYIYTTTTATTTTAATTTYLYMKLTTTAWSVHLTLKAGIFACDSYALYSNQLLEIQPGRGRSGNSGSSVGHGRYSGPQRC